MLVDYQMERQVPDKKLFVSADTTVPLWKRHIFVSSEDAEGSVTLTFPNVGEAEDRKFTVSASSVAVDGDTRARTVLDFQNGGGGTTGIATTGVEVELESIGTEWIVTRQGA